MYIVHSTSPKTLNKTLHDSVLAYWAFLLHCCSHVRGYGQTICTRILVFAKTRNKAMLRNKQRIRFVNTSDLGTLVMNKLQHCGNQQER